MRQLTVEVPKDAKPGQTKLRVSPKDEDFSLLVTVPAEAAPGDELVLKEQDGGEWACCLQRLEGPHTMPQDSSEPATTICLLHVPLEDACACFEGMAAAARRAGAFVSPKLARGAGLAVPGVVAREAIDQGEVLIRMPAGLHVSPETCRQVMPELHAAVEAAAGISEARRAEAALTACVAALLREAAWRVDEREGAGPRTPPRWQAPPLWHAYAEALLGESFEGHPYWRSLKEPDRLRAQFEPSGEAEYARMMAGDAIAIYELVAEAVGPGLLDPHFEAGLFLQARLCLLTREFGTPRGSALVPVVDFCNHSHSPGAVQRWSFEEDAMLVVALRAHAPGDEVCISYGPHSAPLLLRTYGFTLPPSAEPTWTYACQASELADVCREACGSRRPAELLEESFLPLAELHLDASAVTPSLATALDACARGGGDAEALLRTFCTRKLGLYEQSEGLRSALDGLRRARASDARSASWWQGSSGEAALASEPGPASDEDQALRVKMSEYLCLLVHVEALELAAGRLAQEEEEEERCLEPARALARGLAKWRAGPVGPLTA